MKKIKNCGKSVKKVMSVKTGLKVGECSECFENIQICDTKEARPCNSL